MINLKVSFVAVDAAIAIIIEKYIYKTQFYKYMMVKSKITMDYCFYFSEADDG